MGLWFDFRERTYSLILISLFHGMNRFSRKFDPFQGSISVPTSSVSSYDIRERRSLYFSDVRFDLFFMNIVHFSCTVRIYFLGSFTHVWASWKLINPLS